MRVSSHASEQYQRTSALADTPSRKKQTEPQAKVTTTSFGLRLGKFGLDFEARDTVLDPSLSRDVREKRQQEQAFKAEAEVENLRATVGTEGATYRDTHTAGPATATPSKKTVQTALAAYAKSMEDILPPPGNMLASVV